MKKLYILILLLGSFLFTQESLGGLPYSFSTSVNGDVGVIETAIVDHDIMMIEDQSRPANTPYRYGKKFEENFDFFSHATKEILGDGQELWRLDVLSRGALAVSLEFSPFHLSEDALLFMYDDDLSVVLGAYSSINNNDDNIFSIPLLKGEVVHIELLIPEGTQDQNNIVISEIIHDYRDILNLWENYESDRDCGDNVNCSSANNYQDPVNAAAFLDMGGYICSGSMINNTNNDLTPYFLTAWHCVTGENVNTFRFYFNYETSGCSGNNASYGSYAYSSDLLVTSGDMDPDFALLLITDDIYSSWNVFYAGWDRSSSTPTLSCGVHHPGGAPKKINFDNDNAYNSGTINWGDGYGTSPAGSHWEVYWDEGGTEGGSSGSPLFDDYQRIVGQLSGGSGACGTGSDSYGKLYRAFSTSNIENWLCPGGACPNAIDGIYTAGEADYITITNPNGGETLDSGGTFNITWDSNASSNVSIKLYVNSTFNSNITTNTSNDGSYTWNIPSSISAGSNYKIKITSNSNSSIYDYSDATFTIASPSVDLSIGDINVNSGVIDIDISNENPVSGFQFVLDDTPNYITITGAGGGLASNYGFTTSTNESGTVLSFSLTGAQIPPGDDTLIKLYFDIDNPGTTTSLCIEDVIISDPNGDALAVNIGDCEYIELLSITTGDINFDGTIDILDVVVLVNAVLEGGGQDLSSTEFTAADYNGDGVLNVIDVVLLVNSILGLQ
tara:strand:+ start:110 stop:2290 length:2181 start_codon:yes stop_codon:yes gene_type:complete